jgi:hypothetical protein
MSDDPKEIGRHDPNRLKGMRMRDEFICPITYALMREPTVASDGHTYEKSAIEKWLRTSNKSPRTGEPLENTLVTNLNLKKLIQDIVQEGGAGFYTKDIVDQDRLLEVTREKILVLECLGPPESDWNQQSFEVTSHGVVGGRRSNLDEGNPQRDIMLFRDIMVSRRHFEICQAPDAASLTGFSYFIRDLGSAGGTYIRISGGKRKKLHIGMIILLGKHQFTVSSVDDNLEQDTSVHLSSSPSAHGAKHEIAAASAAEAAAAAGSGAESAQVVARKSVLAHDMMRLVADAERIIDGMFSAQHSEADLSVKLQNLRLELDHLKHEEALLELDAAADNKDHDTDEPFSAVQPLKTTTANHLSSHSNSHEQYHDQRGGTSFGFSAEDIAGSDGKQIQHLAEPSALNVTMFDVDDLPSNNHSHHGDEKDNLDSGNQGNRMKRQISFRQRRCVLTCCGPDGSPLQGKAFTVTTQGGTLGRKQSNTIATLVKIKDTVSGEEKLASVDSAISSEHARIDFDESDGQFYICDGVAPGKASTNGTWYRLSGPHQESPTHALVAGMEVLIGNIRFLCKEAMTIAERKLEDQK